MVASEGTFRFPHLAVARLQCSLRATQPCCLPAYLGSTLRGAFGHALKQAACTVPHGECERCLLAEACAHPLIFEGTHLQAHRARRTTPPHPYIFRPPALFLSDTDSPNAYAPRTENHFGIGDKLSFEMTIFGEATTRLPYVVQAVRLMAEHGLGNNHARFRLESVASNTPEGKSEIVFDINCRERFQSPQTATLTDYVYARYEQLANQDAIGDTLRLRLLTPVRVQVEGELQTRLEFDLLLKNIMRRLHLLLTAYSHEPFAADYQTMLDLAATVRVRREHLAWHDLERYSNRQQSKIKLGGITGEIEYTGDELPGFAPLTLAGELLHIGAATVFGLGHYAVLTE